MALDELSSKVQVSDDAGSVRALREGVRARSYKKTAISACCMERAGGAVASHARPRLIEVGWQEVAPVAANGTMQQVEVARLERLPSQRFELGNVGRDTAMSGQCEGVATPMEQRVGRVRRLNRGERLRAWWIAL
jgi:hypothetical protein